MRLTAHRVTFDSLTGILSVTIDGMDHDAAGLAVIRLGGKPAFVTVERYHKRRTTGPWSQNHHINGHIGQIAHHTGHSFDEVKAAVKMEATALGYPMVQLFGRMVPKSEAECNTVEAGYLIEAAHKLAGELDIVLKEGEE